MGKNLLSEIIFEDGIEVSINNKKNNYYSYKKGKLILFKTVTKLTIRKDLLIGTFFNIITQQNNKIKIHELIIDSGSGTLNIVETATNKIVINDGCSNLSLIGQNVRSLRIGVITTSKVLNLNLNFYLNSLNYLYNEGIISTLFLKAPTSLKTKKLGIIYNNDFAKLDKDGNVLFIYDDDYNKLINDINNVRFQSRNNEYRHIPQLYQLFCDKAVYEYLKSIEETIMVGDFLKMYERNYRYNKMLMYKLTKIYETL